MWWRALIGLMALIAGLWLGNSSMLAGWVDPATGVPTLLAHRGVHQVYVGPPPDNDTCTARPIAPPEHDLIENTLPSMAAAFDAGAEVVEIDVHLTPDGIFAVFHDWTLDCRTDGKGVTHKTSMPVLRSLDVGYGYRTADGETPLRGSGVGELRSLDEVLKAFPAGRFLINFKSNRPDEGEAMAAFLSRNPAFRHAIFGVYGGQKPTRAALAAVPGLAGFDKSSVRECLLRYAALGWTGYVPHACRTGLVALPVDYAPYFWGWPLRFERRMEAAGSRVILVGPSQGVRLTSGIDSADQLAKVPPGFRGLIWTDRVEIIAPLLP